MKGRDRVKLQDKVVFITDADHPSGQALMRRLAQEGAHFIVNSESSGQELKATLSNCESLGTRVRIVNIDLCNATEVSNMLSEAEQHVGTVDIMIHNRRRVAPISVEYGSESLFLDIMDTHAKAAFVCTQAVGQQMSAANTGKIIYITSIHSEKPTGASFAYSAAQGAIKMLAREAALELGRFNINVNTIELGPVEGDDETFHSDFSPLYDSYRYKVPSTVLGDNDDLADCVLYLSSEEARHVNGADIRLDGGFVLHYMDHKMRKP
jgi:glucose 1-dehydrogenase